jgi:hypothetical protein
MNKGVSHVSNTYGKYNVLRCITVNLYRLRELTHSLLNRSTAFFLGPTQHAVPPLRVISEEQFNTLPEIRYQRASDEQGEPPLVCDASAAAVTYVFGSTGSEANGIEGAQKKVDVEQPLPSPVEDALAGQTARAYSEERPGADLTTTCTTCSICIDEYEVGERLTLLPRCQHAFHRDCIMPWLLERQGRCPLCKKHVMHGAHDDTASVITDEESNEHTIDSIEDTAW